MSSADFVQVNGLGIVFHSLIHLRMPSSSSVTLGVKCRWQRGCFSSHWWIAGTLCVA
jgi:hypothetical protein